MIKTDSQIVNEAKALARAKRCFVVARTGYWLVYRKSDFSNVLIGKRTKPKTLLSLIKKV